MSRPSPLTLHDLMRRNEHAEVTAHRRRSAAHRLLDRVRDGQWHSVGAIERALRDTGDLPIRHLRGDQP